jgi:hypothetical protein
VSRRPQAGVALITAMIIVIIMGGMAAAFLTLSFSQSKAASNGSEREVALHIAEAGIEDTINKLTGYSFAWLKAGNATPVVPTGNPTPDYMIFAGATVTNIGTVNSGTFSAVVTNTTPGATVVYTGPFAPTAPPNGYLITSAGTRNGLTRTLQVVVGAVDNSQLFKDGLFGDVQVDALGTFFSDGYDSTKGAYASQPKQTWNGISYVDPTGNIGSNGNIITNGSVTVMGNATPGPGGSSGPGGTVYGSTTPAIAPQPLSPAPWDLASESPSNIGTPPTPDKSGNLTFAQTTPGPTVYHVSSLTMTGKTTIQITGQVKIYVDGAIDMGAQSNLQIGVPGSTTDTSKLQLYQNSGANDITINGQAMSGNTTADRFQLYSQTTGTIKFNGGSTVYAAVYAPQATFTNNGGNEFFGAMVAKSMKLTGTAAFHYDENLARLAAPIPDFKILSWVEIPNQ